jgi:hypothetical protein
MAFMKISKDDKKKAIEDLKTGYIGIKQDQEIYTFLRRSGSSSRDIDVYIVGKDNTIWRITWSVAAATGHPYEESTEAIRMRGGGMDLGFQCVYDLSKELFGDGYKLRHRWM